MLEQDDASVSLVLVVDDEAAIREAVCDVLELAGIAAVVATNGHEAIDAYRRYGERVRLVLLDLRMPGMGGVETYHNLRNLGAVMPIVLSSGYDEKIAGLDLDSDPQVSMLRKPYALEELLAIIYDTFRA